jgi:hypothetical protein
VREADAQIERAGSGEHRVGRERRGVGGGRAEGGEARRRGATDDEQVAKTSTQLLIQPFFAAVDRGIAQVGVVPYIPGRLPRRP